MLIFLLEFYGFVYYFALSKAILKKKKVLKAVEHFWVQLQLNLEFNTPLFASHIEGTTNKKFHNDKND